MRAGSTGKIMNAKKAWIAAVAAAVLVFSACGRKAPEGVLAYIPADTPYAIVNLEPVPQAVIDDWRERLKPVNVAYEKAIARAATKLAGDVTPAGRAARAVLEELKGQASFDGF